MTTVNFDEPFTLVMEPAYKAGIFPQPRYEITCVVRRIPGPPPHSKIFIDRVKDVATGEEITDEGQLPSLKEAIRAMQLRDWAAVNEETLMGDSHSFVDNFKFQS